MISVSFLAVELVIDHNINSHRSIFEFSHCIRKIRHGTFAFWFVSMALFRPRKVLGCHIGYYMEVSREVFGY